MPEETHKVTLHDLGADVLSEIITLLSVQDVQSLQRTSRPIYDLVSNSSYIWHKLYRSTFGTSPTPYSASRWPELYRLRSRAKVYTWGSLSGGRLGYFRTNDAIPDNAVSMRNFTTGVTIPVAIPGIDGVILADVSAGGFSFQMLTDRGEIYSTGVYHAGHKNGPGPARPDLNELQHLALDQERDLRDNSRRLVNPGNVRVWRMPARPYNIPVPRIEDDDPKDCRVTNSQLKKEHAKGEAGTKFISVSSGRSHFVALDSKGDVWSWDGGEYGIKIKFIDSEGFDLVKDKRHKVMRVVAGWTCNVGYLYGYGLVVWRSRNNLSEYGQYEAEAMFTRIQGTDDLNGDSKVLDFVALDGFLIYVTKDGKVWRNDLIGEESFELTSFHQYITEHSESTGPKFERVSGNFQKYAVFANDGQVLIGSHDSNEPTIVPEIQNKGCIAIAIGDYHFLALLRSGELLSWGLESNGCGCLGLGQNIPGEIIENSSVRVRTPTRVNVGDKKVLAIAASGWQSSAIISDSE